MDQELSMIWVELGRVMVVEGGDEEEEDVDGVIGRENGVVGETWARGRGGLGP